MWKSRVVNLTLSAPRSIKHTSPFCIQSPNPITDTKWWLHTHFNAMLAHSNFLARVVLWRLTQDLISCFGLTPVPALLRFLALLRYRCYYPTCETILLCYRCYYASGATTLTGLLRYRRYYDTGATMIPALLRYRLYAIDATLCCTKLWKRKL